MTGRIKQAGPFAIGTVTLTLIAVLFALVITGAIHTLFGGPSTQTIHATFADAQQLKRGDPVRIHGVQVGKVDDISEDRRGPGATVTLDVKRSSGPVHADATATLKWRLLLGRSFYVALDPGTDKAGELRDQMIPMSQTGQQVELDQLSSVDGGAARRGLQTMPGELAKALADPQAPTRALDGLARVAPSLTRSLHAARGAAPDADLQRLVSSTAVAVDALDTPAEEMRGLVSGAAATLDTISGRRADVGRLLHRTPAVMRRVRQTFVQVDQTLDLADPLVARLQRPATAVGPTLAALRPTVNQAQALLQRARPLVRALHPAARELATASRNAVPTLDGLTPSLDKLADVILPATNEIDPATQHSAAQMVGTWLGGIGPGAAAQTDQNGRFIRFPLGLGSTPAYLPCQTYLGNPDKAKWIECQSLQAALTSVLHNPFGPSPGPPESRRGGAGR